MSRSGMEHSRTDPRGFLEAGLVLSLSALMADTFLKDRRATTFELISLGLLLVWRMYAQPVPGRKIPQSVLFAIAVYLLSQFCGAYLSPDRHWAFAELRRFVHLIIGGLLFQTVFSGNKRTLLVTCLFAIAAFSGVIGILQYFGFLFSGGVFGGIDLGTDRPHGFISHPILYAEMLAFICAAALVMLIQRRCALYRSAGGTVFLAFVFLLTLAGIIASNSRGVWIALIAGCSVTLIIYDRKKAVAFLVAVLIGATLLSSVSGAFRQRLATIVTSVYTEDGRGSTGNRIVLWKGALMIFKEHPLFGIGTWRFQPAIESLIRDKKLEDIPMRMHAHNIFLHALATRGIIGLISTVGMFVVFLMWGAGEVRGSGGLGGYIIILCTVLAMVGGLTEIDMDLNKFLAVFSLTIGLLGPLGSATEEEQHAPVPVS